MREPVLPLRERVRPQLVESERQRRRGDLFGEDLVEARPPDKSLEELHGVMSLKPIVGQRQEELQPPLMLTHGSPRRGATRRH